MGKPLASRRRKTSRPAPKGVNSPDFLLEAWKQQLDTSLRVVEAIGTYWCGLYEAAARVQKKSNAP